MMPDEQSLLAAVIAAPEDDLPRLVYADWLEEHGRPHRAEFIRAQCRLAADPAGPDAPLLAERAGELGAWLGRHEPPAVPDPPVGLQQDYASPSDWHRGFPARTPQRFLATSRQAEDLCRELGELFRRCPPPELWVAVKSVETLSILLEHPVAGALRGLSLRPFSQSPELGAAVRAAAGAPRLAGLTRFRVEQAEAVTPADLAAVGAAAWLPGLTELVLRGPLTDDHLGVLARFPPMPRLVSLALNLGRYTAAGIAALAGSGSFPVVRWLNLSTTRLDRGAAAALAGFDRWRPAGLELTGCQLGPAQVAVLARAKHLRPAVLHLVANELGDAGVAALASSAFVESVHTLRVPLNQLGDEGLRAVAESGLLGGLRALVAGPNRYGGAGLAALAGSKALRGLLSLDVAGQPGGVSDIPAADVAAFLKALDMPDLRRLCLRGLRVGTLGAKALAASDRLPSLKRLDLTNCRVPAAGVRALLASPHRRGLIDLDLHGNPVGDGADALADPAVLPDLGRCRLDGTASPASVQRLKGRRAVVM